MRSSKLWRFVFSPHLLKKRCFNEYERHFPIILIKDWEVHQRKDGQEQNQPSFSLNDTLLLQWAIVVHSSVIWLVGYQKKSVVLLPDNDAALVGDGRTEKKIRFTFHFFGKNLFTPFVFQLSNTFIEETFLLLISFDRILTFQTNLFLLQTRTFQSSLEKMFNQSIEKQRKRSRLSHSFPPIGMKETFSSEG